MGGFRLGSIDLLPGTGTISVVEAANGAGKTTLLRVAAGIQPLTAGRRECDGVSLYLAAGSGSAWGKRLALDSANDPRLKRFLEA